MDRNLTALKPALVWKHFAEIVRIPRPSSHEEKIRRYILDFARAQGLECKEDAAHNVYVRKPASKGMEDRKGVILQAHLDMVPQKNNDKEFDFTKDPIDAYIDGGWVTADGTTLGADNGIGAAAILAVLEDKSLVHGPLEALFTATEETGMDGAFGLKKGLLKGDILLNLDSEEEGELYVGCAGGLDANITFKYKAEPAPARNYTAAKISVKGFKGGHSGIQIICQRGNANKVLFRLLNAAPCDVLLASVDGGGLRNAIPREAEAVVLVRTKDYDEFAKAVKAYEKVIKAEYAGIEDAVSIKVKEVEKPAETLPKEVSANLVKAVAACPDGVQRMSVAMPGLVQTSTNLARVVSDGRTVKLQCLLRSSVNTEKEALGESIAAALREKKPVMLASLAERFGVSELEVARALPDEARAFAGKDAFDTVWQALASWENATFIMAHLGSVIEIKGKIPEGRHGHGYFNLSGGSGLGGHLKIDDLGHICFLSLPFMGLESHSVQFFNAAGMVLFSVYVGRENRQLIPAARESFFALREAVGTKDPS